MAIAPPLRGAFCTGVFDMGFISPNGVTKKQRNIMVSPDAVAAGNPFRSIVARTVLGGMTYAASYATDFPTVVGIGGTYDPANTGANLTLSVGDTEVSFPASPGSSLGSSTANIPATPIAVEFEVLNDGSATPLMGLFSSGGPPFDVEGSPATNAFCSYVDGATGNVFVFGGAAPGSPIATLNAGDVLGIVVNDVDAVAHFYVNGVNTGVSGGIANNVFRLVVGTPGV